MAASSQTSEVYQCRGLRKWADARCEQCTVRRPAGHPFIGFYCNLHQAQAPKPDADTGKMMVTDECKQFLLQRVDSFRSEEELFAAALLVSLALEASNQLSRVFLALLQASLPSNPHQAHLQ